MLSDVEQAELTGAPDRLEMWAQFIDRHAFTAVAELGVARGIFAERMLKTCPAITSYYMIDPWRHLPDWNKPANREDSRLAEFFDETMERTSAWENARIVLRGRTTEVIQEIPDASLDFAYVDGDHTLRGITIDLLRIWSKMKPGGFIAGDDFCPSTWQHADNFEPTLVFPWAVYFAEGVGAPFTALPHNQFLMQKSDSGFTYLDAAGDYSDLTLRTALTSASRPGRRFGRR